jgi:hypothetical protein
MVSAISICGCNNSGSYNCEQMANSRSLARTTADGVQNTANNTDAITAEANQSRCTTAEATRADAITAEALARTTKQMVFKTQSYLITIRMHFSRNFS